MVGNAAVLGLTLREGAGKGPAEDDIRDLRPLLVVGVEEQADVGLGECKCLLLEPFDGLLDARWVEGQGDLVVPLELDEDRDDLEVVEEDQAVDGDARLESEAELDVRRAARFGGART